jgi:uncharacterized membrane protein YfcA
MNLFLYIIIGGIAGICGGLFGIGGAMVIIPILVLGLKFPQHLAQGTTLAAMIPPIGLFAAWRYYQQGQINIIAAVGIAIGFLIGGYFGGGWAQSIDGATLKRAFGSLLILLGLRMVFFK